MVSSSGLYVSFAAVLSSSTYLKKIQIVIATLQSVMNSAVKMILVLHLFKTFQLFTGDRFAATFLADNLSCLLDLIDYCCFH